jgi:acyl CoA:acetate/3-ketoacid CoA transferase alpha subunit/acyl CoA:acetate/3-ketoacid CoA transferase beta subunit
MKMDKEYVRLQQIAQEVFSIPENEGPSKVIGLGKAVRESVRPGMTLSFCGPTNAVVYEIIRMFWGTKPKFVTIAPAPPIGLDLVHCGLVKKVIGACFGEGYPKPGLSRVFARAYAQKIDFEVYSLAGLQLRLMAGALGVGFLPTRSMVNSTMVEENVDNVKMVDDPFSNGRRVAVVKALNPDLTIVHALACDQYGNAITPPPASGTGGPNYWASFASKEGVLLTTERLVSTDFIRNHSYLVRIPGYRVRNVSVVPFGAHPLGVYNWGIEEFECYNDDVEFQIDHQQASKDPDTLDTWLRDWVLNCANHEDYLSKLGSQRIAILKSKANKEFWQHELTSVLQKVSTDMEYTDTEMMMVAASRKIQERVLSNGYKVLLCGLGASGMAGWLAGYELKQKGYNVEIVIGNGMFGVLPRPADPMLVNVGNMSTCKMITDLPATYGFVVCGEARESLAVLASGQVDKYGNLNAGRISKEIFLQGPSGAGDACKASEVVAMLQQKRERFVEKVPYITSSGETVKTLVSTLGVFEKLEADGELALAACLPSAQFPTVEERIKNIKDNCGWELKILPRVEELARPSFRELAILRMLDPDDYFRD